MAFPDDLAATLTGTSKNQLYRWRRDALLVPEVQGSNPALYSFRDLVAIRTIAFLRSRVSLQRVRRAFSNLDPLDFTDHPSAYRFGTDGKSIAVADEEGRAVDLTNFVGQVSVFSLEEVFAPFKNRQGHDVVDFRHPRPNLEVSGHRMGGWPTIRDTRITYDTVANLVADGSLKVEDVSYYYPQVSPTAVEDAVSFDAQVRQLREGVA